MFSVRISSYGARGKFGEHEKCVRVARGAAESNSSFLSDELRDELQHQYNCKKFSRYTGISARCSDYSNMSKIMPA